MATISDTLNHGVPCEAATRRQVIETVVILTTLQENCGPAAVADSAYFGDHRPTSTTFGAAERALPGQVVEIGGVVLLDLPPRWSST